MTEWIKKCQDLGAGEFLVTSIDKDGTEEGFDLALIEKTSKVSNLPVVVSGGFGKLSHLDELIKIDNVTGLAIAKSFHNGSFKVNDIKEYLIKKNKSVRI